MSLYLKYRPKTVEELDLASVRESLTGIIKANKFTHAYLLTGPRGAGKTSTARIIARIVNCEKNADKLGEPCNTCRACKSILAGGAMDFIEIDAASNRGIDDIRELKEKIRLAPAELRYKVYVIDEVHMLTTEAFNALLKTLEEPPEHALFILCTTETHKVPETIISRCVRIQFSKATPEEMRRSFTRVVTLEGRKVEDAALDYLARSVDGSFRDGVKILEQVLTKEGEITLEMMEQVMVGASGYKAEVMVKHLIEKDVNQALACFQADVNKGVDLTYLLIAVMKGLRDKILAGAAVELAKLVFKLDDVARKISMSQVPELLVEMVIIEWCGSGVSGENGGKPSEPESRSSQKSESPKEAKPVAVQEKKMIEPERIEVSGDHKDVWKKLMAGLTGDSITMGALLSKATPAQISGDTLTIQVAYGFHRDQIMTEKVRAKLEKLVSELVGREMKVVCEVGAGGEALVTKAEQGVENGTIDEAMAIFS